MLRSATRTLAQDRPDRHNGGSSGISTGTGTGHGQSRMERNYEAPAARFALEILRRHPQISYEHAVSAAEYAGVHRLPRDVFFDTAERLGIPRDRTVTPAPPPGSERLSEPDHPASESTAHLFARLEAFQQQVAANARIRAALERMRQVVRAALAES